MWKFMKITDVHLIGRAMERKVAPLKWAADRAIDENVSLVVSAGDLTEHDQFGDKTLTPGGVVELWRENFARPLYFANIAVWHVRGNHDKRAPNRGSSLAAFTYPLDFVAERISYVLYEHHKPNVGFVFVPWLYPVELIGPRPESEGDADYQNRFTNTVTDHIREVLAELRKGTPDETPVVLIAHCRVPDAVMNDGQLCPDGKGLVIRRETLELFDHLHLGDIHRRQDVLDAAGRWLAMPDALPEGHAALGGRGGYTGALTQEGLDEAGNPSGVEIVTVHDDGHFERIWHECPCAHRYYKIFVATPHEAQALVSSGLEGNSTFQASFIQDGSEQAATIAEELTKLEPLGLQIKPQDRREPSRSLRTEEQLERLDDPPAALSFYGRANNIPEEQLQDLHRELSELLGGCPCVASMT